MARTQLGAAAMPAKDGDDSILHEENRIDRCGEYVARCHMKAINDTDSHLAAALAKKYSIGIADSYSQEARFLTDLERLDRHLEKRRRENPNKTDSVSICWPNHLHEAHIYSFDLRDRISGPTVEIVSSVRADGLVGVQGACHPFLGRHG